MIRSLRRRKAAPVADGETVETAAYRPAPTQFIPGQRVDGLFLWVIRLFIALTFVIGIIGNLVRVNLATVPLYVVPLRFPSDVLAAIAYQLVIQFCQIGSRRRWGSWSGQYLLFILCSIVPSCWTYGRAIVALTEPSLIRLLFFVPLPIILFVIDRVQDEVFVQN